MRILGNPRHPLSSKRLNVSEHQLIALYLTVVALSLAGTAAPRLENIFGAGIGVNWL